MNVRSMQYLEDAALLKVVVVLWDSFNKSNSLLKVGLLQSENAILSCVDRLKLPKVLKIRVVQFVKIMGMEIFEILNAFSHFLTDDKYFKLIVSKLTWTPEGKVNLRNTIELLISEVTFSLDFRYKIACAFCIEEKVLDLWGEFSDYMKSNFLLVEDYHPSIFNIWSYCIEDREDDLLSSIPYRYRCIEEYSIFRAIAINNKAAVEFYFEKIPGYLQTFCFIDCLDYIGNYIEWHFPILEFTKLYGNNFHNIKTILLFLFSHISQEVKSCLLCISLKMHHILICYLDYLNQGSYLDVLESLQPFMTNEDYRMVIIWIVNKIKFNFRDYDYYFLINETCKRWEKEPHYEFNSRLISESLMALMPNFEEVVAILKCFPPKMKEEIILYCQENQDLITELSDENKVDFLNVSIGKEK